MERYRHKKVKEAILHRQLKLLKHHDLPLEILARITFETVDCTEEEFDAICQGTAGYRVGSRMMIIDSKGEQSKGLKGLVGRFIGYHYEFPKNNIMLKMEYMPEGYSAPGQVGDIIIAPKEDVLSLHRKDKEE